MESYEIVSCYRKRWLKPRDLREELVVRLITRLRFAELAQVFKKLVSHSVHAYLTIQLTVDVK